MAECKSVRSAYGKTLVELGKENKNIVVMIVNLILENKKKLKTKMYCQ